MPSILIYFLFVLKFEMGVFAVQSMYCYVFLIEGFSDFLEPYKSVSCNVLFLNRTITFGNDFSKMVKLGKC